jgi:hypothetical protein
MLFSAIRKRVTPATVIATIALVFAMSGGAYAAGKYLITSTKQISPKVLKSLTGKTGPAGKAGTNGAPGANGAQGPAGATGPTGHAGASGETGAAGPAGAAGASGKEGKAGREGSPWTAGGTLPSGKTETGVWTTQNGQEGTVQISFSIPLAEPLKWGEGAPGEPEDQVHYINPSGNEVPTIHVEVASHPDCPGTVAKPEAVPGHLCIYAGTAHNESESAWNETIVNPASGKPGAATAGAVLIAAGRGTWAVTAK